MNEFSFIEKYFAPLAANFPGSLNLTDDAACIDVPSGKQLIITKDAISSGTHFTCNESPDLISRKLLRVNLSDLAAKGVQPYCYFIAVCLPKDTGEEWIASFAEGLKKIRKNLVSTLAGGDTTSTRGPLCLSLTAIGLANKGTMLKRSAAQVGDNIYVSGTLGEAVLGLSYLSKNTQSVDCASPERTSCDLQKKITEEMEKYYIQRYLLPQPRLALGQKLVGIAHACMDISDGLMQDMGHICKASGVGANIEQSQLPMPLGATNWQELISGGDDYELLFTAPESQQDTTQKLAEELSLPITRIGEITNGGSAHLLDKNGKRITPYPERL